MLRISLVSAHDRAAVEWSLAVARIGLDGVKLEDRLLHIDGLDAPHQLQVAGQQRLNLRQIQIAVDRRRIERQRLTDNRPVAHPSLLIGDRRQLREKRILGSQSGIVLGLGRMSQTVESRQQRRTVGDGLTRNKRVYGSHLARGRIVARDLTGVLQVLDHLIGLHQQGVDLRIIIGSPELEARRTLKQFAHALGLLHARQLDQNAARVLQTLNIGLRNAETVDTIAEHVERVLDRAVGRLAEHFDHIGVRTVRSDLLAQLGRIEDIAEPSSVRDPLVCLGEKRDIVARTVFLSLGGLLERLIESGVLAVVRKSPDDVLDRNFEHHVHTAAQVEAQVDLLLLALLVVELDETEVVDRLGLDRVEVILLFHGIPGCIFGRFLLDMPRNERKRQLIRASDRESDGQKFQCTFILHVVFSYYFCFDCRLSYCNIRIWSANLRIFFTKYNRKASRRINFIPHVRNRGPMRLSLQTQVRAAVLQIRLYNCKSATNT